MRHVRNWSLAVLAAATFLSPHAIATTATAPASVDLARSAGDGKKLDAAQVERLEEAARIDPTDAAVRAKLLGYYSLRLGDEPARRLRHVLWMIQNRPTDAFVASDYCRFD